MNLESRFLEIKNQWRGSLEFNVNLSRYSYYQIGGPAAVLATPKSFQDLELLNAVLVDTGAPFFILGWGSNLLFRDEGFAGVIIRMKQLFTECEEREAGLIHVGASLGCSTLLRKAQEKGWGGLAHLTGIPGSVGGMVVMNAGTHLGEMKDACVSVERVRLGKLKLLERETLTVQPGDFSYRHNHFLNAHDLVLSACLKITPTDPSQVKSQIDDLYQRRKQTQPVEFPSCGSVFMNPQGTPLKAWQVIDQLGLRGTVAGGAQISEKHSNFIINRGSAKAADVRKLIELVKQKAQTELGILMKEEVKVL